MLFADDFGARKKALSTLNFYNLVKKVIIKSGGGDKIINIRIFVGLVHELRVKLDIFRAGLGPERITRKINFGLDKERKPKRSNLYEVSKDMFRTDIKRQKRSEDIVLKEFSMINLSRV